MQIKTENITVKQHHEMIVMKPEGSNRVTLIGRKLYSALVAVTQLELNGEIPLATATFKAPLKDLLITSGGSGEERTVAKKYFQEMQNLQVTWESTAPGDGVKWIGLNMLSQAKIYVQNSQTWLEWAFPPEIIQMIVNPERYAVWNLQITAKLGTYSALALYEICARYRDNPGGLTSRKHIDWWIDALSNTGSNSEKKRREWRKFKTEKITPAIAEINSDTDLEISLIEHKEGRVITEAQFSVRRKKQKVETTKIEPVDTLLVALAQTLGVNEKQLESVIRSYGEDLVRANISALQERIKNRKLSPVGNAFAYLKSILHAARLAQPAKPAENKNLPAVVTTGAPTQVSAPAASLPGMLIEQTAGESSNVESLSVPPIAEIRAEIDSLSEKDKKFWLQEAGNMLKKQKLFSAIHQKRIDENKIAEGLLASTVLEIYATAHYGKDWLKKINDEAK